MEYEKLSDMSDDIVEKVHRLRNYVSMAKLNAALTEDLTERMEIAARTLTEVERRLMEIEDGK